MKDFFSIFVSFIAFSLCGQTPITLSSLNVPSGNYKLTAQRIEFKNPKNANLGADFAADFATASDSLTADVFIYDFVSNINPAFPSNAYVDSFYSKSLGVGGFFYHLIAVNDSSGIYNVGWEIPEDRQGLGNTTGNTTDSLIIPFQSVKFSNNQYIVKFPLTYLSNYSSSNSYTSFGLITVALAQFNNDTVRLKTLEERFDTVLGWGTLRIPHRNGGKTLPIPVLFSKRTTEITDSFFINSSPMPANLVQLFNLPQGQKRTFATGFFRREGYPNYLAQARYKDNTYQTFSFGFIDTVALQRDNATAIENPIAGVTGVVYPNPAQSNSAINVELISKWSGLANIAVYDMLGRVVYNDSIEMDSGFNKFQLRLSSYTKGIHILKVTTKENAFTTSVFIE